MLVCLEENFKPMDARLTWWKECTNIVYRKFHNKKNADNEASDNQKEVWSKLIKDYEPDQIFNSDETGSFYRALPEHTLMFENE